MPNAIALENGKINVDLEGERRGNELSGPCWTLLAKARTVKGGIFRGQRSENSSSRLPFSQGSKWASELDGSSNLERLEKCRAP